MRKSQKNKKTASEFQSVYTVTNAVKRGSVVTRLSMIIMGLGNIAHKQIGKGLLFLLGEVIYIAYMALAGVSALAMLPSLGDQEQQEVWNEAKGIYEYVQGDNSLLILLFGIVAIFITVFFGLLLAQRRKECVQGAVFKRERLPCTDI